MRPTLHRAATALCAASAFMVIADARAEVEHHDLGNVEVTLNRAYDDPGGFAVSSTFYQGSAPEGEPLAGGSFEPGQYDVHTGGGQLRIDFLSGDFASPNVTASQTMYPNPNYASAHVSALGGSLPLLFTADEGYRITGYRLGLVVDFSATTSSDPWGGPAQPFDADYRLAGSFRVGSSNVLSFDRVFSEVTPRTFDVLTAELPGTADLSGLGLSFAGYVQRVGTGDSQASLNLNYLTVEAITAPVPEPGAYALLFAGLGLVAWVGRKRR